MKVCHFLLLAFQRTPQYPDCPLSLRSNSSSPSIQGSNGFSKQLQGSSVSVSSYQVNVRMCMKGKAQDNGDHGHVGVLRVMIRVRIVSPIHILFILRL